MSGDRARIIARDDFSKLFTLLHDRGYTVVGPTVRDQAIVYDELAGVEDLPVGWTDEQQSGHYRLRRRGDAALFGYVVGPHSWKKYLHPPNVKLFGARRGTDGDVTFESGEQDEPRRYAFLGVRSCELHALAIFDTVLGGSGFTDTGYVERRKRVFTIAVNCGVAGGNCFCVSMKTGPRIDDGAGHDLVVTEVVEEDRHVFVIDAGSDNGAGVLADLPTRRATLDEVRAADAIVSRTADSIRDRMDPEGLKELLYGNWDHPRWDAVAGRCLTCANCTMVCPTCFCTTVEDVTDISGANAGRWRRWDSCFTLDFTYLHGAGVRQSARSRYRHWITHKLATWHDQFGSSGCVGCGRCISWCPVGIDITEEVAAIRQTPASPTESRT